MESFGVVPFDTVIIDPELRQVMQFPENALEDLLEYNLTSNKAHYKQTAVELHKQFDSTIADWLKNAVYTDTMDIDVQVRKPQDIYVRWVSEEMGFGCFARKAFKQDDVIDVFAGVVTHRALNNDYAWLYQAWMTFTNNENKKLSVVVDALHVGNALRFVNHDPEGVQNVKQVYVAHGPHWYTLYKAKRDLVPHEELYVSYGPTYWSTRKH